MYPEGTSRFPAVPTPGVFISPHGSCTSCHYFLHDFFMHSKAVGRWIQEIKNAYFQPGLGNVVPAPTGSCYYLHIRGGWSFKSLWLCKWKLVDSVQNGLEVPRHGRAPRRQLGTTVSGDPGHGCRDCFRTSSPCFSRSDSWGRISSLGSGHRMPFP